jgi:hypothetical protein
MLLALGSHRPREESHAPDHPSPVPLAWAYGDTSLDQRGLSAIEAAALLLYAAYDLHRSAEGADEQRDG